MQHLVMADAAALCKADGDHVTADTLLAVAFGLYPFCVQYDERSRSLVFRRSTVAGENRDRDQVSMLVFPKIGLPPPRVLRAGDPDARPGRTAGGRLG